MSLLFLDLFLLLALKSGSLHEGQTPLLRYVSMKLRFMRLMQACSPLNLTAITLTLLSGPGHTLTQAPLTLQGLTPDGSSPT